MYCDYVRIYATTHIDGAEGIMFSSCPFDVRAHSTSGILYPACRLILVYVYLFNLTRGRVSVTCIALLISFLK